MRRMLFTILLFVLISVCFCGCRKDKEVTEETEPVIETEIDEIARSISELDADAVLALEQGDNSLDAYSMCINLKLSVEEPEDALVGGAQKCFLGKTKAFYFKKHLFQDYSNCWDELTSISMTGDENIVSWDFEEQIWDVGMVLGTDHYLVYNFRYGEDGVFDYYLEEYDEKNKKLREIPLAFLNSTEVEFINYLMMDEEDWIHFVRYIDEESHYMIVSTEGEVILDYCPKDYHIQNLVPLYDGKIACLVEKKHKVGEKFEKLEKQLLCVDMETGESSVLLARSNSLGQADYWVTLTDEDSQLYVNSQGIYRCDSSGENIEILYKWVNHGISVSQVLALQQLEEGLLALIYESAGEVWYLCIEPTTQQVEIQKIVFAVSPAFETTYKTVVTEFNKKYPACHIELKSDYEDTTLLTELIAGEGPVLIDTSLTGFDNHQVLWEPLDKVLEELEIMDELQNSALEIGKINGELYGIVTNFWLETLIINNSDQRDWNYEEFLKCIDSNSELEAIVNSEYLEDDGLRFVSNFLVHGMGDNYFFDEQTGEVIINNDRFRRMLQYIKKYCVRADFVSPGEAFLEGKVLCNTLKINRPEQMGLYRVCYGEDINYIGFPGNEGANNYLNSFAPLAIRKSASKEEKTLACAFIKLLLSYDCQQKLTKDVNFCLSIRKDILEEQINSVDENSLVYSIGFETMALGDKVDNRKDGEKLYTLIEQAEPKKAFPRELNSILTEELQQYFDGVITEDVVIQRLENRISLYLDERGTAG